MADTGVDAPRLPAVEELSAELRDRLTDRQGHSELWQVVGEPTAGKTALLQTLARALGDDGLAPVIVAPPVGALDAAGIALLQIGAGLKRHGLIDRQLEDLAEPSILWSDKLGRVHDWIGVAGEKLVLLCDEPERWAPFDREELSHFANRADDVRLLLLFSADCQRIVTGRLPTLPKPSVVRSLKKRSDPKSFLLNESRWAELAVAAKALYEGFPNLDQYSNLELRLLVAHVALSSVDAVRAAIPPTSHRSMISLLLADRLSKTPRLRPLWQQWQQLAFVRRPIGQEMLALLGAPNLDPVSYRILRECLLYTVGDRVYVMHRVLQVDALKQEGTSSLAPSVHRTLAGYYAKRFKESRESKEAGYALLDEMEAFYHAMESGDPSVHETYRVFFVDQLDALGRRLSQRDHKWDAAVQVFEHALDWDESDDYAHHYLGFNLDIQGRDPERVEQEYVAAIELAPYWSLWWARYIDFLIIRGRIADAEQAWTDALDSLTAPYQENAEFFYDHLHAWVARTLLHRGDLEFARRVLEDVPLSVESERLVALRKRLAALDEARVRGAFVPGRYLEEPRWWERGPFLLDPKDPHSEERLVRWLAARVEGRDENHLHLAALEIHVGSTDEPRLVRTRLPIERFNKLSADDVDARSIDVGTFLEIGLYVGPARGPDQTLTKIRMHRDHAWVDNALPRLFPDPARYLRRFPGFHTTHAVEGGSN